MRELREEIWMSVNSEIEFWRRAKAAGLPTILCEEDCSRIRAKFHYDPDTGIIRFRTWIGTGRVATHHHHDGYFTIGFINRNHLAHRAAWLMHYGSLPPKGMVIDHKNGNGKDNRIDNLRACTQGQNTLNKRTPNNNTSGVKGVYFVPSSGRYKAVVNVGRKAFNCGFFATIEEATEARRIGAERLHGEFVRHA